MPVLKYEILGNEIWQASDAEIRSLWNKTPEDDRHRFWSNNEVDAYYLASPEEWAAAIAAKKAKPGKLPSIRAPKPDVDPAELSSHCRHTNKWCSEAPCIKTCE